MVINFGVSQALYSLASILGLLIASILLFQKRKASNRYNLYLGLSFLFVSLAIFLSLLIYTELVLIFPYTYTARWGNFFAFLFMPFSYFYFRANIRNIPFRLEDGIHFIPALFYFVDYLPFFLMNHEEKLPLMEAFINNADIRQSFSEGWLAPLWFHLTMRTAVFLFYFILQLHLLMSVNAVKTPQFLQDNKHWFYWAWIYVIHLIFYFLPPIIYLFLDHTTLNVNIFAEVITVASIFVLCVYLFFRPEILYGISGIIYDHEDDADLNEQKTKGSAQVRQKAYLNNHQVGEIVSRLQENMEAQQPYLIQGYTLKDLSNDVDIPIWLLSTILNRNLNMNFNEYLNKHRVDHCLQKIQSGDYKMKTLEGLALECGFNNRNSFTIAFKNFHRKTPSEYIKEIEARSK